MGDSDQLPPGPDTAERLRVRTAPSSAADKTVCERCGAEMFRMHAVWRCPRCGYKTDCSGW